MLKSPRSEDRALRGRNPSAAPGADMERGGVPNAAVPPDSQCWPECAKSQGLGDSVPIQLPWLNSA